MEQHETNPSGSTTRRITGGQEGDGATVETLCLLTSITLDYPGRNQGSLWWFPLQGTCSLVCQEAGVGQRLKAVRAGGLDVALRWFLGSD